MSHDRQKTFPATLDSLAPIHQFVREAAAAVHIDETALYKLIVAVDEFVTNSIVYGYEANDLSGSIRILCEVRAERFVVRIEDTAPAFDPREVPPPDSLDADLADRPMGGLGIFLALRCIDTYKYAYEDGKNVSELTIHCASGST